MSFITFVEEAIDVVAAVSGLRGADRADSRMSAFRASLYSVEGQSAKLGQGDVMVMRDSVRIGVLAPLQDVQRATKSHLEPLRERVPAALLLALTDDSFSGYVNFSTVSHTYGPVDTDDKTMFGYIFTIEDVETSVNMSSVA